MHWTLHLEFETPIKYHEKYMVHLLLIYSMSECIPGREANLFKGTKSIQQPVLYREFYAPATLILSTPYFI